MPLLTFLCVFSKLPAMVVGIYYFSRLTKPYKMVLWLVGIGFICEIWGYYIAHYLHKHNVEIFNIYILLELWTMVGASCYLIHNVKAKKLFLSLAVANTFFWMIVIIRKSLFVFANVPMITGCILMTFIYMYVLISNGIFNRNDIIKQPVFWLSISLILYTAGDIPFVALHSYIYKHGIYLKVNLQNINSILNVVRYPLVCVSFVLLGRANKAIKTT